MRSFFKLNIYIFFLLCFATIPSFATVIVEGSFKAVVNDYYHYMGEHSDFGTPALGTELVGSFSYAVTRNLTGPVEEPNMASYGEGPDWINFDINVGGIDFSVAPSPGVATNSGITVQKTTPDSWWDFLDMFWMSETYQVDSSSISSPSYVDRGVDVLVWGGVDDIGAIQDFSFENSEFDASLYLRSGGIYNGNHYYSSVDASIVEFKIASRTADVPEPSGLLLSSLAFLLIGWRLLKSRSRSNLNG